MNISWETDSENIQPERLREMTFYNNSVKDFTEFNNKFFVIASKGIGKTLLLKLKRYILEKEDGKDGGGKEGIVHFLPSSEPYLDFSQDLSQLNKNQKKYLESWDNSKFVWQISLQLAIISFLLKEKKIITDEIKKLPLFIQDVLSSHEGQKPNYVFDVLFQSESISKLADILISHRPQINSLYESCVTSGIYVFIDRLDQALEKCSKKMWINMQAGLLEAAWELMKRNNHVKIYCSIRQEAYYNYESPNKLALYGSVTLLKYTQEELLLLLDKLSIYYEGISIYGFIGAKEFIHPYTNNEEKVDEYILRHTISRPRDLIALASKIHIEKKLNFDVNSFRTIINTGASQEIVLNLFSENGMFLDSLSDIEHRNKFLALLNKNVFKLDEVIDICREYNDQIECDIERCKSCKLHHPFSELYNIGLIGTVIKSDISDKGQIVQKFQQPHEIKEVALATLPIVSQVFLIHPALNDYIRQQRNQKHLKNYDIIQFIRVGNGIPWTKQQDYAFEFYSSIGKIGNTSLSSDLLRLFSSVKKGNKSNYKKELRTLLTPLNNFSSTIINLEKVISIGEKLIDAIG